MSLPQIAGFELRDLIGRGSCGAVYRAERIASREPCAVKVFSSMAINRRLLGIAMRGLEQMPEHPGLLRPLAFDFDNSPYYCALPLVGFTVEDGRGRKAWETPTLESCCGRLPPDEAWRFIYEVGDAMSWLHRNNLVHCNLRPRSVLVEDDPSTSIRITDLVQGWIGGLHHFETTDHFMHISPEQAEHPDGLPTHGTQWDVYAFGVFAFRLLTGQFPRGVEAYQEQVGRQGRAPGQIHVMDNAALLHAVRSQSAIRWPASAASRWDEKRRHIIEQCLELEPGRRWLDMREVMREFEKLESAYLLEDAREKIGLEKRRRSVNLALLRASSIGLGLGLVAAVSYGLWYGLDRRQRLQVAEEALAAAVKERREEVASRDTRIESLMNRLQEAHEDKRVANANLEMSQEAVDQFLTQLLQMPAGIGLENEISAKQLDEALAFYTAERKRLKDSDDLLPQRARNYFNTAQIMLRKGQRAEAEDNLEKARSALLVLRQKQPGHGDASRLDALLGRACRSLGSLKAEDGRRGEALDLFRQAVAALAPAAVADPKNRDTRLECASAWYELGRRARRDGKLADAVEALGNIRPLLDPPPPGAESTTLERFVLTRSRVEQGLAQRDSGATDSAMKTLFDAMEEMVKLVDKQKPSPQREEMALTLGESYIEFGEIVAGKLGGNDARDSHSEAVSILAELVRAHPQWGEARFLLGRAYGAMATVERDLGNAAEALRRQTMAVQALGDLCKQYPANARYLAEFAYRKGNHAELLCNMGKAKDSIPVAQEGIASIENLLRDEAALDVLDRKACGVLLAQLFGVLGHSSEAAKNSKLAKESFSKATAQWEKVKARHGDDEVIEQGLNWTKDRLAKLK